jgi:hypothetical protein
LFRTFYKPILLTPNYAKKEKSWIKNEEPSTRCSEARKKQINISSLKSFVAQNYPAGSPLQIVLVDEENVLSLEAFLAKLPVWLKLSNFANKKT